MYNRHLKTFIQVADARSFSKAADLLYVTPAALIKQINLLEEELDLQLFSRTPRGIQLTKAGQSLYHDAKYIIQYTQDAVGRAKQVMNMDTTEKVVRIGTSLMTPSRFLIDLWPQIQVLCPDIKIQMVPFENTPENAQEILANLGQNIDVVAGIFDDLSLKLRKCKGLVLSRNLICCALSIHHPLAVKKKLQINDLYGETLMLLERGKFLHIDALRDDIWQKHPKIRVLDFPFYNASVFNQCENSKHILMAIQEWEGIHPLIKVLPVEWDHAIPFGLLHSPEPTDTLQRFLSAVEQTRSLGRV